MTAATDRYALGNERTGTSDMLNALSAILDTNTQQILTPLVPVGGRCLEVGAGNGSIAAWMADRVGPDGHVIATDLKPDHVARHPQVEVVPHDLRTDPLPAGPFHVIHARLLFAHLADRDALLPQVAEGLAPGGSIVVEDWGNYGPGKVLSSPWPDTADLYDRYQKALMATFAAAGNDPTWSGRIHTVMLNAGLTAVRTVVNARAWDGGSAGTNLPTVVSTVAAGQLTSHGVTEDDLATLRKHLADPRVAVLGNATLSVIGRRSWS